MVGVQTRNIFHSLNCRDLFQAEVPSGLWCFGTKKMMFASCKIDVRLQRKL